ncbi:(ABC) transporter [Perkinsus chesapeaki]|uniref:(ABC) transporter n=1 Tax=Perkinsus chesapeaki TaxID=330153 RepID=A0A7J6N1A4_PERCH|nr:(ABC) transporter [Perkinsus chesapeaki]
MTGSVHYGGQLIALLVKHWKIKIRHPVATIMELFCPAFMVLLITLLPILFGVNLSVINSSSETRLKADLNAERRDNVNALIGLNMSAASVPRDSVEVFSELVEIEDYATQQQSPMFWLFNKATLSWMGNSCWCKTLAIAGPSSSDLAAYLANMYTAYTDLYDSSGKKHNLYRFSQFSAELADWNVQAVGHLIKTSPMPVWTGLISEGLANFETPSQFGMSDVAQNLVRISENETCLEGFRVEDISCLANEACYNRVLTTRCGYTLTETLLMFEVQEIIINEALKLRHQGDLQTVFVPVCGSATDQSPYFLEYESEKEIESVMKFANYGEPRNSSAKDAHEPFCGAIILDEKGNDGLTATIRLDSTWLSFHGAQYYRWLTKEEVVPGRMGMHANYSSPPSAKSWYMRQGFLALQLLIGRFYEHKRTGDLNTLTENDYLEEWDALERYRFVPFPSAPHPSSAGLQKLADLFEMLYWAFAFVVAVQVGDIVKERRHRHFMKISGGLTDWVYHLTLFLSIFITSLISSSVMSVVLTTLVFHNSNFVPLFILLLLLSLASSSFALACSALFSSERLAAVIAFLIYGGTAFVVEVTVNLPLCILPGAAAHAASKLMVYLEVSQRGLTFGSYVEDVWGASAGGLSLICISSFVIWWTVFYYAEQVITYPGITAVTKKWYFPILPSYWRGIISHDVRQSEALAAFYKEKGLTLRHVTREYPAGVVGVRNVTMRAPLGKCAVLLGKNGAGKSTLISLVVHTQSPSYGTVIAPPPGRLGFCPQHSMLWSELTVGDHIDLWCGLRGTGYRDECLTLAAQLNLTEQWKVQAGKLSGGQRRCLSVVLAFAGDPDLVVLDEPSTGLDANARIRLDRAILTARNPHRALLVSTHYMDEAETLADDVVLLDEGEVLHRESSLKEQNTALTLIEESMEELEIDSISASTPDLSHLFQRIDVPTDRNDSIPCERFGRIIDPYPGDGLHLEKPNSWYRDGIQETVGGWKQFSTLLVQRRLRLFRREWRTTLSLLVIPAIVLACLLSLIELGEAILSSPAYSVSSLVSQPASVITIPVAGLDNSTLELTASHTVQYNVTPVNSSTSPEFSDYLLSTRFSRDQSSVGAFYRQKSTYQIWHNTTYHHSAPAFASIEANRRLHEAGAPQISFVNHPLPVTNFEGLRLAKATITVIAIATAMSFIPGPVISFAVLEKRSGITDQLQVAGVLPLPYWASNLVADFTWIGVGTSIAGLLILIIFDSDPFAKSSNWSIVTAMLLGSFALCVIPFTYLLSFLFRDRTRALVSTVVCGIVLTSLIAIGLFAVANIPPDSCDNCYDVVNYVSWCLNILPHFALGNGLLKAAFWGTAYNIEPWSSNMLGSCQPTDLGGAEECIAGPVDNIIFLLALAPVYFSFLVFRVPRRWSSHRGSIRNVATAPLVELRDVSKAYGSKTVVNCVSFKIETGEVVGLLGSNGAGKTTLFKMLCGFEAPTSGCLSVCGEPSPSSKDGRSISTARTRIGYCPQHDTLWDSLSPKEHLNIYCRLRGVSNGDVESAIDQLIAYTGLEGDFPDRPSVKLSGGNRRKLSMAIALTGSPSVVLLDEPTAGMDPIARQRVWDLIRNVSTSGERAVVGRIDIVTSHNMEEAEAVCSRVVLLSRGIVQCTGTPRAISELYSPGVAAWVICRLSEQDDSDEPANVEELALRIVNECPVSALQLLQINATVAHYASKTEASSSVSVLWTWFSANKGRLRVTGGLIDALRVNFKPLGSNKGKKSKVN